MHVLSVVGNRPQFVKSAPLSLALREAGIREVVLHTGQHYDSELSQVFFEELELAPPSYELGLQTADPETMRPAIAAAARDERPDWMLVYGDTNSTLAGARAGEDLGIPVAHVEAGLRSGDLSMPEERNRIAVDQIAALLFAPDERSRLKLEAERVRGRVEVVGDVMADASMRFVPIALERSRILQQLGLEERTYVLGTVHREANVHPDRLRRLLEGLGRTGETVVFPAHPRTRSAIDLHAIAVPPSVRLLQPVGYLDFAALLARARVVATDSGGLQKEAYWAGVPCVTMRSSTEWVDTVELGANVLVDGDPDRIGDAIRTAEMPPETPQLYGDGHASERIANCLLTSRSPV